MSVMVQRSDEGSATCRTSSSIYANKKFRTAMEILEKISLIALAIFAAYLSPKLFFPFFGFGISMGCYLYWNKEEKHLHKHDEGGGCSQGFIEQLTGVRLPPPFGLAANIAMTVCHIDHHQTVFIPLIGLNSGMWVGKMIGQHLPYCAKRVTDKVRMILTKTSVSIKV